MIEASRRQELFDTLKAFNNAAQSIRLYPPHSPQLRNAIERGYTQMTQFLRHHGEFTLALKEDQPVLGGEELTEETLKSFGNLIIFRQLSQLGLPCLVIGSALDHPVFLKIIEIFAAKVAQIKGEGGGRSYASRLGLDHFFPASRDTRGSLETGDDRVVAVEKRRTDIPREYLNVLLGVGSDGEVVARTRQLMSERAEGSKLVAAAVASVLENVLRKGIFGSVPALTEVFVTAAKYIPAEEQNAMANSSATLLLSQLGELPLVLLFAHSFTDPFGDRVGEELRRQVTMPVFETTIATLRRKAEQLSQVQTSESPQLAFVSSGIDQLLASKRGQQFLGQERAKSLLAAGEQNRRAQRVQAAIKSLMQGKLEVLQSDEFCNSLPMVVRKLEGDSREKEIAALLQVLVNQAKGGEGKARLQAARCLIAIAKDLIRSGRWDLAGKLTAPLLEWFCLEGEEADEVEMCCQVLQSLMNHFFSKARFERGDAILAALYKIRTGGIAAPQAKKNIVANCQDQGVDRTVLAELLRQSLADPQSEVAGRRLTLQGPVVSRFLVEALMKAEAGDDRMKILDLLTGGEADLAPIVVERLAEPMPWFGKRNLLKLLSDCGDSTHIPAAFPFLRSEDLRVQREAFTCLYKISGKRRKSILLQALGDASEVMKPEVVKALAGYGDGEVADALSQLLKDQVYFSDESRDPLLKEVCRGLGRCSHGEAEKALLSFMDLRGTRAGRKIGEDVWQSCEEALGQIAEREHEERQRKANASKLRKQALTKVSSTKGTDTGRRSITGLAEERKVEELFRQGNAVRGRVLMLELVGKMVRLRRFTMAEQLRDWLIQLDPEAMGDIIRAADMIESGKRAAMSPVMVELWSDLSSTFSSEEFSAFYHSLDTVQVDSEEVIARRGEMRNAIFFINSGRVKLSFRRDGSDILVKTLSAGEVFGVETFFSSSVWTCTASALGDVELAVFEFDKLEILGETCPDLERKLRDFCEGFSGVALFDIAEHDRRAIERFAVETDVQAVLLGDGERTAGVVLSGRLADISVGGLSYSLSIDSKQNSRMLLGRKMRLVLATRDAAERSVVVDGQAVAVQPRPDGIALYTVHVEFSAPLDPAYLNKIVALLEKDGNEPA